MLLAKQFCSRKSHLSSHKERWQDKQPYFILKRNNQRKKKSCQTFQDGLGGKSEVGLIVSFAFVWEADFIKERIKTPIRSEQFEEVN